MMPKTDPENIDIRLYCTMLRGRKARALRRRLGADAVLSLLQLWCFARLERPSGALYGLDSEAVATEADWSGDPVDFVNALVELRWLDMLDDRTLMLHNWTVRQPYSASSSARRKRARKAASARWKAASSKASILKRQSRNANRANKESGIRETGIPLPDPSPDPSPDRSSSHPRASAGAAVDNSTVRQHPSAPAGEDAGSVPAEPSSPGAPHIPPGGVAESGNSQSTQDPRLTDLLEHATAPAKDHASRRRKTAGLTKLLDADTLPTPEAEEKRIAFLRSQQARLETAAPPAHDDFTPAPPPGEDPDFPELPVGAGERSS